MVCKNNLKTTIPDTHIKGECLYTLFEKFCTWSDQQKKSQVEIPSMNYRRNLLQTHGSKATEEKSVGLNDQY